MGEGLAAWMGIAAIARLALAIACCPPSQAISIPLCGDDTHRLVIPIDRKKAPRDDQPAGCHALCGRKLANDTDDCSDC
jgi:hypothetical protein